MGDKPKVIVTRGVVGDAVERIRAQYEVVEWTGKGPIPVELLMEWIADCDGYYGVGDPMRGEVLERAKKLKVISQVAVGVDNIDTESCTKLGIAVGHTPNVLTDATADLTITLLLMQTRRIVEHLDFLRAGHWGKKGMGKLLGTDLRGKTIGIVGMGAIGIAVAQRAAAFGLKVLYYNRRQRDDVSPDTARYVPLEQLLRESDFVSVHAPLTEETKGMFDAAALALMKPTAVLINMARGQLVDTEALYEAIKSGRLGGAALDVTDPEPIAHDHPLLALPSVVVVPHIGSATYETREAMALLALENLQLGLSGQRLKACYNPDVYKQGAR